MSIRYGWCLTGDCDTDRDRGGCPVQLGGAPACDCPCHGGTRTGRSLLASRRGTAPATGMAPDAGTRSDDALPAAA